MSTYQETAIADRRLPLPQVLLSMVLAGAASALVVLVFSPFSAATAAFSAPLYAVIAGAYSFFPFLARRFLGFRWAATVAGCLAGLLSAPVSPIGLLIVVPFIGGGAAYDSVVWVLTRFRRLGDGPEWVFVVAAVISAFVLFLVSLPVLSNRIPIFLVAVLGGRVVGQLVASALAGQVTRLLLRPNPRLRTGVHSSTRS